MAPKRKQTDAAPSTRVTRSSTRLAAAPAPAPPPEPNKRKKKAKTAATSSSAKQEDESQNPPKEELAEPNPEAADGSKTIIIEHCKQCNSFKTRAVMVKEGVEKGAPGVKVVVNPEKPRRGCFEIREQGGCVFVSLLDMKRPFKPMKELDMESLISDIVGKIK